ncbi:hypothetical protein K0M31_009244 [Melipona bicolor]|uniref:Uncharacterized protein n=1 Tax=Melipona bicolor TaxID=60889 RepID=A0AA40FP72_9HYME|nr:hypothetical protein K0M31_009244 [Melipona bicolor]
MLARLYCAKETSKFRAFPGDSSVSTAATSGLQCFTLRGVASIPATARNSVLANRCGVYLGRREAS